MSFRLPISNPNKVDLGRMVLSAATLSILLMSSFVLPLAQGQTQMQSQNGPKYGGTLIMGVTQGWEPSTLNPNITWGAGPADKIFNGLLEFDLDLNPKPDLAESWKISDDGKTYTFHLVRNATFHDGTPVTSADVKFSIEEMAKPYNPVASLSWQALESVETPDDYTVVIKLKEPSSSLLYMLALGTPGLAVLPKHLYEGTDILNNPYNQKPIGSGPFKFVSWEKGNQIVMERNENYFKKGLPYLDRIIVRIFGDGTAVGLALENGEIDYASIALPFPDAKRMQELENINVAYSGREGLGVVFMLIMNHDNAFLSNSKVRQALAHAIDRDLIRERVYLDIPKVAQSSVSSTISWAFNPDVQKYDYDPEKANRLLDEAGYPMQSDGKRFGLTVHNYAGIPDRLKMLDIMREQLRDVGIDLKVITKEGAALRADVYGNRNFDLFLVFWWTGPDPAVHLSQLLHSKEFGKKLDQYSNNIIHYQNDRVDQLLDAASREVDRDKEAQLLYELQDILARDLPFIPLFEPADASGYSTEFVGLVKGPFIQTESMERVWWTGGKSIEAIDTSTSSSAVSVPSNINNDLDLVPVILIIVVAVVGIGGGIGAYAIRRRSAS